MEFINYFSNAIIPIAISIIIIYAIIEKIKIFDAFIEGAKDGMNIIIDLFPTLIGLFVSIGVLRNSGIIDFLTRCFLPIINSLGFPKEVMPLIFLRPISRGGIYCYRYRYNEKLWG